MTRKEEIMKARLLRKLRKKCCKKYCITKNGGTFKVWFGCEDSQYYLKNNLVDAKELMKKLVCKDIKDELFKIRYKRGRSHCIKYYPWVILFFICLPSSAFAQTKAEVLAELHRQNIPCASIVLAQARLESGNMKSDFYRKTNNLFGLKKGKKYATYKTWRDSIKDYKLRISSRYNGGCYYKFLTRIGYASDKEYIYKVKKIANEKVCQLRKSSNRIGRFTWVWLNKERKRWRHGIQCKEMQVV